MARFGSKVILFFCGFLAVWLVAQPVPVVSQQVMPIARSFTVQVDVPGNNDGSGVMIAKNNNTYYVLTAWHVVNINEAGAYVIRTYDNREHTVAPTNIQRLSDYDLAVLSFNSFQDYPLAGINEGNLFPGDRIAVSGWRNPTTGLSRITPQLISGTLTGHAKPPEEGGYSLTISAAGTFLGMSGGPIVDDNSRVVGIIGRVDTHVSVEGLTGLSLGIPISAFLDSNYRNYVQDDQILGTTGHVNGEGYHPEVREKPRITRPTGGLVPAQGETPRISQ